MSSSSTPGSLPPRRPSKRSKLRNGTFIIPSTGERSRRTFTLRSPSQQQANDATPSDEDDDSEASSPGSPGDRAHDVFRAITKWTKRKLCTFRDWLDSPKGRGVLKCTLAYTIASLWTFLAPLSGTLGHLDGKHVVATITVYFHPSRSAGAMIECAAIAIIAVAYAEMISILSMAASVLFGSVLGMVALAYTIILVVFIGAGFGFIGWVKQRMNHPSVNVGCTLAALGSISIVTKENSVFTNVFSDDKIWQVFKILVFGVCTTVGTNLLVWRVSARASLRQSMIKASTSLGDMLSIITHGFLSGFEEELASKDFTDASKVWASCHVQMTKNLKEAKYEHYVLGHEQIYQLEKSVVKSIETLAQSIGGLRSAAHTQFELMREGLTETASGALSPGNSFFPPQFSRQLSGMLKSGHDRFATLSAIDEAPNESSDDDTGSRNGAHPVLSPRTLHEPSQLLELFITLLGPPMKSLAYTLSEVLRARPFGDAPNYDIAVNDHFRDSLSEALGLYNSARAKALQELYRNIELGRPRSEKIKADFEEVAAACGHFSFSLQSFGEEMTKYLDVLDDLKHTAEHSRRSWGWLLFWRQNQARYHVLPFEDPERENLIRPIRKSQLPRGIPDTMVKKRDTFAWQAAPDSNWFVKGFAQHSLKFFRFLGRDDIRFGLKVGIGATLWAMLAFIEETRETYMHWRGEWGLLSFMIVCSMTVGAANTTGWTRFIATLIGATCAVINWNVSRGYALPLVVLGYIVAFGSFFVMIDRGNAPLGRTILLAYNVSTLYAYSLSQSVDEDDDDEGGIHPFIMKIATHRAIAVTAGILWGVIVCRLVWPISARKKFKEGLSVLYLQMGLIWKRGPLAILLRSDCSRSYLKSGEQAALQRYASRLETLRNSATNEFELRGPFPYEAYGRIMTSTNRVLDAFYAMSLVTQRRGTLSEGERALLLFTADERAQLCSRICHVFQVLASSAMLEYPLTDAIPSVAALRDRLLGKIFQFRKDHTAALAERAMSMSESSRAGDDVASLTAILDAEQITSPPPAAAAAASGGGTGGDMPPRRGSATSSLAGQVSVEERDYALLYAYALVTGQVAEELKIVEKEIEGLFGVLHEESLLLQ